MTAHVIILEDHQPHHLTKYEHKGTKNSIFKFFIKLGKNWKCNLSFSKISISHLFYELGKNLEVCTAPDQYFKIQMLNLWMSYENVCPNVTFTVENEMGNSHKRG